MNNAPDKHYQDARARIILPAQRQVQDRALKAISYQLLNERQSTNLRANPQHSHAPDVVHMELLLR